MINRSAISIITLLLQMVTSLVRDAALGAIYKTGVFLYSVEADKRNMYGRNLELNSKRPSKVDFWL